MTIEKLEKFIDAGFTKDEILKLAALEQQPDQQPEQQQPAQPEQQPAQPEQQQTNPGIEALSSQMSEMLELMRGNAFFNAKQPTEMTVDDVIASIINPDGSKPSDK